MKGACRRDPRCEHEPSTPGDAQRLPDQTYTTVPYWLCTDPAVFEQEMSRIFCGRSWPFVGFAAEIAEPGSFKTTFIGNRSVIICRNRSGELRGFVNRCAHRGVQFCRERFGKTNRFTCPYHQWTYDLYGALKSAPFIQGVKGQGGMPEGFDLSAHGLQQLKVSEHNGVLFASFDPTVKPFVDYLGESNRYYFERVFDGRELRILGYTRQLIRGNWKLMFENIKDPYHATLLHVFLVTFGLFRADQEVQVKMAETGRHGLLISRRGEQKASEHTKENVNLREDFKLQDTRLLGAKREYKDSATVVMQTLWPNLTIQQQSNTIAIRRARFRLVRIVVDLLRLRRRRGDDDAAAAPGEPHECFWSGVGRQQRGSQARAGWLDALPRHRGTARDGWSWHRRRRSYGDRSGHPRVLPLLLPGNGNKSTPDGALKYAIEDLYARC